MALMGPYRAAALDGIATRRVRPVAQVDLLIESGAEALRRSAPYQLFQPRRASAPATIVPAR